MGLLILGPVIGEAKSLYVDGVSGNDAVSYANNGPSTPWRTIGRAAWGSTSKGQPNSAEAAQAGDVVHIAAGTYVTIGNLTGGGAGRQDVAYQSVNAGTPSTPIRFTCPVGPCVLTYSSGAGPMIGSTDRNHIHWSGNFHISEATAATRSDTGPVVFFRVQGGLIEGATLTGNPNWASREGDNYPGVRLEDASGVRVANNIIRDYGGQLGDRNHNGIETYRSYPVLIENNYITNCAAGIYMKAVHTETLAVDTVIIRYNRFVGNRWGVAVLRMPMTQSRPMLIYQNIFQSNREAGMWINAFDNGVTDPTWIRVVNNTFVDNPSGMFNYNWATWKPNSRHFYVNNVVAGTGLRIRMDTADVATNSTQDRQAYDRNLYGPGTFSSMGGATRTLSFWQGLGQDVNSLVADPQFADGNFRLAPTSPARTLGRAVHGIGASDGSVIPAGAYITGQEVIGPSSGYTPPTLPSAPRNFRITTP